MKRLFFIFLSVLVLSSCASEKKEQPNVILFLVDDLGWTDVACNGSDYYLTPNVDQLAAEGVRFVNGYAACTVCSPTRASIMSGKYPARINCTDWITGHKRPYAKLRIPEWTMYMDTSEVTLAEVFKKAGYSTVHLGKWHLGEEEMYWPENQGFDMNLGGWKAGSPRTGGGNYFAPYKNPRLEDGPEGEYLTERLSREAVKYIQDHKDVSEPFFMNMWLYNVHTPLQAKKEKIEKYIELVDSTKHQMNPVYAAMVEHMDEALGAVLSALEETGQYENTIILFTGDNGGLIGNFNKTKRKVTSNYPLRSGKGDIYEGGTRVPFIVSWPEHIEGGRTDETPVISPDIYSTLIGLAGIDEIAGLPKNLDGADLSPVLLEKKMLDREAIFWHYPHYHLEGGHPYSAVRMGDWKLIKEFGKEGVQLYNLREDIGELNELSSEYPEKADELFGLLENWWKEVDAQFPTENPNFDPDREGEWQWKKKK